MCGRHWYAGWLTSWCCWCRWCSPCASSIPSSLPRSQRSLPFHNRVKSILGGGWVGGWKEVGRFCKAGKNRRLFELFEKKFVDRNCRWKVCFSLAGLFLSVKFKFVNDQVTLSLKRNDDDVYLSLSARTLVPYILYRMKLKIFRYIRLCIKIAVFRIYRIRIFLGRIRNYFYQSGH